MGTTFMQMCSLTCCAVAHCAASDELPADTQQRLGIWTGATIGAIVMVATNVGNQEGLVEGDLAVCGCGSA